MDIGRNHDFVLVDKKARGLQPDQQILAGGHFRFPLADFGSESHGPSFDFPACQAFWHFEPDFGLS